jgi:predicted ATP-grasp superfamily ATP-dependent carboligase
MVGFADALAAIETVWSLLGAGFSVSAFTRAGRAPVLRRVDSVALHEITAPEHSVEDSLRDLRAAMQDSGSAALMPLDDAAVWLSQQASEGAPWVLVGPRGTQAEVAVNKQLQCNAATVAGFPVPDTQFLKSPAKPGRDARFPLVVRPAVAAEVRAGRLVTAGPARTCADAGELNRTAEAFDPGCSLMVQPRLQGIGEGVFGLATPAGILAWSAHRRIRMMNPAGSGSSACVSIPLDDQVRDQAESMLTRLKWSGLFMLELLRDSDGTRWFVELNGRAWGSMALARAVGLEYPAWAVAQAFGEQLGSLPSSTGDESVRARHLGREIVHLLAVIRGPRSTAIPWPSRFRTIREVLSWRQGDRAYNWRPGEFALLLEDTVSTVFAAIRRTRPPAAS